MSTGNQTVVDFGAHVYPESVFPEEYKGTPFQAEIGEVHYSASRLLEWLQKGGIDEAVVSMPYYMGYSDADVTADVNNSLLSTIENYDQLYGLCAVPVAAGGEQATKELQRCLDNGYNGGALPTKVNGIELSDEALDPVLDVANKYEAPLLVHPKLNQSLHPDVLDDTYLLNAVFGREIALAESIWKVIHTGVFDRYPDLKLVYHHLGGHISAMLGRIHLQLDSGRWPGRQNNVKSFDEFFKMFQEHIYVDTSGFFGYESPLETTLDALPTSNVVFGTDAPYEPRTVDEISKLVDTVATVVEPDDVNSVLGANTRNLLVNL